jgi:hypothetical protein
MALAVRGFLSAPEEPHFLAYALRWTLPLNIVFDLAVVALGIAIALERPWTRMVGWMSCIVLALLVPGPSILAVLAEMAVMLAAAIVLYLNPPPDPSTGHLLRPRRVTFPSRLLGVLLALSGLARLWLSLVFGPEALDKLWSVMEFQPGLELTLVNMPIWSAGLAVATVVVAIGIGLRRHWGLALGAPLCLAGFLNDARAAIWTPFTFGPEATDFMVLRWASAALYGLGFLYCVVQLMLPRKPLERPKDLVVAFPPETRAGIADDANWRESLLASLRAAGVQPASRNAVTGVILPLLGILVVGLGWTFLNLLIQVNPPRGGEGSFAALILMTVALAAISVLLIQRLIAFFARRFWRFRARSAEEELERPGTRKPCLYLRSFALDEEIARPSGAELVLGTTPTANAEQTLAKILSRRRGPVIAIGMPDEKLPGLGAARFYAGHDVWHQKVADVANVSQLVIWTTGTTEGLRWEISHLLGSVPPAKLIVWAHPYLLRLDKTEREREWSAFRETLGKTFPKPLPERLGKIRYIWFRDDWEPVPVAPRWGKVGVLFRWMRDAQAVALKQLLRQKSALSTA